MQSFIDYSDKLKVNYASLINSCTCKGAHLCMCTHAHVYTHTQIASRNNPTVRPLVAPYTPEVLTNVNQPIFVQIYSEADLTTLISQSVLVHFNPCI